MKLVLSSELGGGDSHCSFIHLDCTMMSYDVMVFNHSIVLNLFGEHIGKWAWQLKSISLGLKEREKKLFSEQFSLSLSLSLTLLL